MKNTALFLAVLLFLGGCQPLIPARLPTEPVTVNIILARPWVACHESGHAVFAHSVGFVVNRIVVVLPGDTSKHEFAGQTSINFGAPGYSDLDRTWNACGMYMAGHAAELLCHQIPIHDSWVGDRTVAERNAAWIAQQRPFYPPWSGHLLPAAPTAADILAECRRHAFEVLAERSLQLRLLSALLHREPDGELDNKQVSAFFEAHP